MKQRRELAALVLVGTLACNSVLGIEESTLDFNFNKPAAPDGGGAEGGVAEGGALDAAPDTGSGQGLCGTYCDTIMKNCTGNNQQYVSKEVCLDMCPLFEPGAAGALSGNGSNCRLEHSKLAADNAITHCPHAGPIGFGTCGTNCESFCLVVTSFCGVGAGAPYASDQACRTACTAGEATTFSYTPNVNISDRQSGNTLNCRAYHIQAAMERGSPGFKTTHCPHTAPASDTCK